MDNQFPPGYLSYGQQFKTEQGQQQPASQQSQQQGQQQGQQGQQSQQFKSEPGQQQQQQQQQQPPQHPPQQQPGLSSFGSLSATPGHSHSQQQDSPASGHPTLPPLQGQNGGYAQFGSMSYAHPGSQSHTPTTPHTPVTSSMGNGQTSAYSHVSPASAMGPPSYAQNPYGMSSSSMMYPSSTSTSMPPSSSAGGLPTIRPMPPGGVGGPMGSLPTLPHLGQQSQFMQNEEAPTHVVGSQGRRGILPSAPGRPNAPVSGSGQATKNMIPQKDADGKYPCPHCNKTYLHAKHLKRHLLRRESFIGKHCCLQYTDCKQILETDPTHATCAKTLSLAVTFSSVISKSALFAVATLPELTTWHTSAATPTLATVFLLVDKKAQLDSQD
jgi:hypothetical protein